MKPMDCGDPRRAPCSLKPIWYSLPQAGLCKTKIAVCTLRERNTAGVVRHVEGVEDLTLKRMLVAGGGGALAEVVDGSVLDAMVNRIHIDTDVGP